MSKHSAVHRALRASAVALGAASRRPQWSAYGDAPHAGATDLVAGIAVRWGQRSATTPAAVAIRTVTSNVPALVLGDGSVRRTPTGELER